MSLAGKATYLLGGRYRVLAAVGPGVGRRRGRAEEHRGTQAVPRVVAPDLPCRWLPLQAPRALARSPHLRRECAYLKRRMSPCQTLCTVSYFFKKTLMLAVASDGSPLIKAACASAGCLPVGASSGVQASGFTGVGGPL